MYFDIIRRYPLYTFNLASIKMYIITEKTVSRNRFKNNKCIVYSRIISIILI